MRSILITLFLTISLLSQATKYYIAPSGNNGAAGTIGDPWYSPSKAWTAVYAGDTVYMRGGTYAYTSQAYITLSGKNGSAGNLIKLWNYPGEIPIITRHSSYPENYGMYFSGNYVHFKGLEITGFTQRDVDGQRNNQYAFVSVGSNNCIFENLNIHHNALGLYILGAGWNYGASTGNLVLNSDFHHNQDPYTPVNAGGNGPYGNASGLHIGHISSGDNSVLGCRFWYNTDEGFDQWDNDGTVDIQFCWAFWNGFLPDDTEPYSFTTTSGNGCGFKLGGDTRSNAMVRTMNNCLTIHNMLHGFDDNSTNNVRATLKNCTAIANGSIGFNFNQASQATTLYNCASYNNYVNSNIYNASDHVVYTSSFIKGGNQADSRFPISSADFISLDETLLLAPRQTTKDANGTTLPYVNYARLQATSELVNSGTYCGISYLGSAPDLGAFEYLPLRTTGTIVVKGKKFTKGKHIR